MITIRQIDFANDLCTVFSPWIGSPSQYFLRMADAIEHGDCSEVAKLCASLIIEMSQKNLRIDVAAREWIQLFGKLPEFDLLTGTIH